MFEMIFGAVKSLIDIGTEAYKATKEDEAALLVRVETFFREGADALSALRQSQGEERDKTMVAFEEARKRLAAQP